ncbi:MAG: hypothetical protein KC619_25050 [Myxococcales bacterium]|nr:hypothetical protein [Myxococcales bacterium]
MGPGRSATTKRAARTLQLAVIAEIDAEALDAYVTAQDPDLTDGWWIVPGAGAHAAWVSVEPGGTGAEGELAAALAERTGAPAFAIALAGWDDPDHGIPCIVRYDASGARELWCALSLAEALELVTMLDDDPAMVAATREAFAGHDPSIADPWQHARSLGVALPRYSA